MGVVRYGVTTEWLNVFQEVSRRFEATLAASVGLTITQYRILLELDATSAPVRSADLAKMLLLRPSSIAVALGQLEERGYVSRQAHAEDRRAALVAITAEGKATEVRASAQLVETRKDLWKGLSERQVAAIIESTRLASERLHATTSVTMGTLIEPFYTTCIMTANRMFAATIKKECGLSLTEFRILSELLTGGTVRGIDLASRLHLDGSVISVAIGSLTRHGHVEQVKDESDKRNRLLTLSAAGEDLARRGAERISAVNQEIYGNVDESLLAELAEAAVIINATM